MLRRLNIRDFVIVERAQLEFERGFTVLTGETGAGKSILVDALSMLLGERGDAAMVRAGAKQAEIAAEFELDASASEPSDWLARAGLEGDPGCCLVRRVLDAGGRSRAFINGHPSTLAQLRELAEMLLDIHGQHAHQSLLRAASQRELLDAYGGSSDLVANVAAAHRHWAELQGRYDAARRDEARLGRERESLAWQVEELSRLDLRAGEWSELNGEHARLAHAAGLIEAASASIDAMAEDEHAILRLLNGVRSRLARASEYDASLKSVTDLLDTAQIELQEAVHALERYRLRLEVDPQRLRVVEQRLEAVHTACRKFHLQPDTLQAALDEAQMRLAQLELDLDLERLGREVAQAKRGYDQAAGALTQARTSAAVKLGRQVSSVIRGLALAGAKFVVRLEVLAEPSAHGMERIEFDVATHAGAEPAPLSKVASGGELSRLSLAVQSVLSQVARVPTLIFDEVDAGIGGRVAEIVGQMLHRLSARHQVMCVTHLAQVAACADHHYRVSKREQASAVTSEVEALDERQRVQELARMLAGLKITAATLEHAAEMLRESKRPLSEV
ncbi:MAG: DNA repair protein RecN [Burkholderiales bacterium]|nr:DNA repair protein RecN [Burkholderiales bacterium]